MIRDRSKLGIWLEETIRECPRPTTGPWPMSKEAHLREDERWEQLAQEARAIMKVEDDYQETIRS